jgi:hypothetical protein
MAGINRHPAPGLGELQPGWFVVPQNPMDGPVSYVQGIGDILATGGFAVPQNPVVSRSSGVIQPIGTQPGAKAMINGKAVSGGVSGMGCGCGTSAGSCGCGGGMGDISAEFTQFSTDLTNGNFTNAIINDTFFGVPVWAYGIMAGILLFAGGEKHSYAGRARRASRAAASAF